MTHETLKLTTLDDLSTLAQTHLRNINLMLNRLPPRQMTEVVLQLEEIEEQISYTIYSYEDNEKGKTDLINL